MEKRKPVGLNDEEFEFFDDEKFNELVDGFSRRCVDCTHLSLFHVYGGGDNICIICGCRS